MLALSAFILIGALFTPVQLVFAEEWKCANGQNPDGYNGQLGRQTCADGSVPTEVVVTNPVTTACVYKYSDWTPSPCSISGQQTRTMISISPSGCVGTPPPLTQSCTYIPPKSDAKVDDAKAQDSVTATAKITTVPLLFSRVEDILNAIVPFIIGLAILVIIWGILGYISRAGEEEKRKEAKQFIVWSIIGLFIMLSVWGFVNVLVNSFELKNDIPLRADMPSIPCIPIPPATTCS